MTVSSAINDILRLLPPQLRNLNAVGFNNRRRRMLITFIPPLTQLPLFIYGADGARLFLSLHSGLLAEVPDNATVLLTRLLPLTLSSAASAHDSPTEEQISWLREEHQRWYESRRGSESPRDQLPDEATPLFDPHRAHGRRQLYLLRKLLVVSAWSENSAELSTLRTLWRRELRQIAGYSVPLVLTFVLEQVFSVVCVLVAGRLGTNELAAVLLALMTLTITLALFEGISTALDTLCPQAYGAGNFHGVGVHLQRCTAFLLVAFVPFALLWWFSGGLLLFVIDDEEVVQLAVLFLRVMILGAPAYILFENGKRFLQAQGIFEAGTAILFVTAPINVVVSYVLVWNELVGVGFVGAPIAAALNFWLMAILLWLYVVYIDGMECWGGWTKELFTHWGALAELAVPGIIMLEAEYLAYEVLTLVALRLGTTALAAQLAVSTVASLTYMVPFAVSIAGLTRIATFIGAANGFSADVATRVLLFIGLVVAVGNCVVLAVFKSPIAGLFLEDARVVEAVVGLFPLVAGIQVFDGLASVASGVLRAQGRQKIGGVVNLVGYYGLGIPVLLWLGIYSGVGLMGLWIGIGLGMMVIGMVESWCVLRADWPQVIEDLRQRNAGATESGY